MDDNLDENRERRLAKKRESARKHYAANSEEIKAKNKEYRTKWYQENKAKVLAKNKAWREANPHKMKSYPKSDANKAKAKERYQAQKEQILDYTRRWNKLNAKRVLQSQRQRKYGVTPEQVESLERFQEFVCAICKTPFSLSKSYLDHCHRTGRVRGLLCSHCNQGIGRFRDDEQLLKAAIRYLKKPPAILALRIAAVR